MNCSDTIRMRVRRVLMTGAVCLLAGSGPSIAAPCDFVPYCEPQQQAPVQYGFLEIKGWAYYCTGDHPYYWNNAAWGGLGGNNFGWTANTHFSVSENPFAEDGAPSKFDATIDHLSVHKDSIVMTIGCSRQPQNFPAQSCSNGTRVVSDPKCPVRGAVQNYCTQTGPVPVCIQAWSEQCSNGIAMCTEELDATWCVVCN